MEDLSQNEKDLIVKSLQYYMEYVASIIRDRKMWDYNKLKNSFLFNFENEEVFNQWRNKLNEQDREQMKQIEELRIKFEEI